MSTTIFAPDAFGDRFDLAALPLPRRAEGYAVQKLDTDTLLDRETFVFLPVRSANLRGLFASFDEGGPSVSHDYLRYSNVSFNLIEVL